MTVIGIDLGTTFSAVAYVDDQGNVVIVRTNCVPDTMIPSAVLFNGDRRDRGRPRHQRLHHRESHVRSLGQARHRGPDFQYPRRLLFKLPAALVCEVDGPEPAPSPLSTRGPSRSRLRPLCATRSGMPGFSSKMTLSPSRWCMGATDPAQRNQGVRHPGGGGGHQRVSRDERHRNLRGDPQGDQVLRRNAARREVTEAVITYPAYFNENEIRNTRLAGEMAGLKVRTVEEPVAAAVYFGVKQMKDGEKTLVCDWAAAPSTPPCSSEPVTSLIRSPPWATGRSGATIGLWL